MKDASDCICQGHLFRGSSMSVVYRANRKATDQDIIRLNSVGLSLARIGEMLKCHPSTITTRLRAMNIEPADTRRSFMEDILGRLTLAQIEWLADQLGPNMSIKDYVRNLLIKEFDQHKMEG